MDPGRFRNPKCTLCSLHEGVNTVCLFGHGNPDANLMFVGEAPGLDEDETGRPFVGKAGQLLTNILAEFKINRSDVYISNSVKCRPPNNRRPHIDEVKSCTPYLLKEIEIVKPKLLVALGQLAGMTLLHNTDIRVGACRGKVYYSKFKQAKDIPIVITYHPAALARDNTLITPIIQDFEFIMDILKNGVPEREACHYYKGVSKAKSRVSIDLETDGLNPFSPGSDIICIGTTNKSHIGYCTTDLDRVRDVLSDKGIVKIGHNIKYDIKWLKTHGFIFHGPIHDTMVGEHILDENAQSFGLKELASVYTDMGPYSAKFERQLYLVGKDIKKVPLKTVMRYCCEDVDAAIRLYIRQKPLIEEQGLSKLFDLVMSGEKIMADAEIHGVMIDQEKHAQLGRVYRKKLKEIRSEIKSICGVELTNPDSSVQLGKILTGKLGLPIVRTTKGGKVSVDKFALEQLKQYDTTGVVGTILRYRNLRGDYSKYLAPNRTLWQSDGRVHATFNIHGTDTGRYSCVNPNLQQVPRESPIKKIFISSYRKGRIVTIDYDQGELRLLAHEAQEKVLIKAFRDGVDVHRLTASKLFKIPFDNVNDKQRFAGKTVNFGIVYGIGADKLATTTGMSLRSAIRFLSDFKDLYPAIRSYIRDRCNQVEETGYVTNLFGRRRRIAILDIENKKEVSLAHRRAVNAPIQGGLHDLNILSMVELDHQLRVGGYSSNIILAVHDSVILDVPEVELKSVCKLGKEVFENPDTSRFGFELSVPMTVTISVGKNWKEVVELD